MEALLPVRKGADGVHIDTIGLSFAVADSHTDSNTLISQNCDIGEC